MGFFLVHIQNYGQIDRREGINTLARVMLLEYTSATPSHYPNPDDIDEG